MENIIKPQRFRVKRSTLNRTLLILTLLIAIIYGYFYLVNSNPWKQVYVPIGPPQAPLFSHMIYGGFGKDQLNKPMAVTTIGDNVFVSDSNNRRIQIFTKEGTPLNMFGERGYEPGQFQFPYGLTQDPKGRLLVGDMYTGKISAFTPEGKFVEYFGEKQDVGKLVKAPSEIEFFDNKLYVADVEKHRVYVFDEKGKLQLELGKEFKELKAPNGVTVDKETGRILVVDTGHQRVIVYDKDGKVMGQFDGTEKNDSQNPIFANPRGISIDSRGVIYVVSNLTHLIYGYDKTSKELFRFGGLGSDHNQFTLPNGLHIDENNYVYITDTTNNRVAVYR